MSFIVYLLVAVVVILAVMLVLLSQEVERMRRKQWEINQAQRITNIRVDTLFNRYLEDL